MNVNDPKSVAIRERRIRAEAAYVAAYCEWINASLDDRFWNGDETVPTSSSASNSGPGSFLEGIVAKLREGL